MAAVAAANDAEARFLESRNERLNDRRVRQQRRQGRRSEDDDDDLNSFWSSLRKHLSSWEARLEIVISAYPSGTAHSESEKRTAHIDLCQLQEDLRALKRNCLATASSTAVDGGDDDNKHNNNDDDDDDVDVNHDGSSEAGPPSRFPIPPIEMPLNDLRLLHDEFTKYQSKLDDARRGILPRGKFVFRRYRAAIAATAAAVQKRRGGEVERTRGECAADTGGTVKNEGNPQDLRNTTTTTNNYHNDSADPKTVQGYRDSTVHIYPNGKVVARELNPTKEVASASAAAVPVEPSADDMGGNSSEEEVASVSLLRNIHNCEVILHGVYKTLHLVSITESSVTIVPSSHHSSSSSASPDVTAGGILGAAHVTGCEHSSLAFRSHQLRLHESKHLTCRVDVSAGTIMEDCSDIHFYVAAVVVPPASSSSSSDRRDRFGAGGVGGDNNTSFDVKDFNWLKTGIPSPNFSVEFVEGGPESLLLPPAERVGSGFGIAAEERRIGCVNSSAPENKSSLSASVAAPAIESRPGAGNDDSNSDDDEEDEL